MNICNLADLVKGEFDRALVFFVKDMKIAVSYKMQFVFQFMQVFFSLVVIYFIGSMVHSSGSIAMLARYGNNYFCFVLVGLAVNSYLRVGLITITNDIRQMMNQGILEAVCASGVRYSTMLIDFSLWQFGFETFRVVLYFLLGWLFFGFTFRETNWLAVVVVMAMTILIFMLLSVISCSILIVVKRGDPVNWIFSSAGAILAGTMFPVEVLPGWLRKLAWFFPLTHSLEGLRRSFLANADIIDVSGNILVLTVFVVILIPVSVLVNRVCINSARKNGSLGTY